MKISNWQFDQWIWIVTYYVYAPSKIFDGKDKIVSYAIIVGHQRVCCDLQDGPWCLQVHFVLQNFTPIPVMSVKFD